MEGRAGQELWLSRTGGLLEEGENSFSLPLHTDTWKTGHVATLSGQEESPRQKPAMPVP